ncbi:MAG: AAA family ATPase [Deltaproteobacteria bacterium]|nr:AAA family ATPase [Deltaproteobacteria bacterium]MBW2308999.1 AAA family ATPase [Deltaproteobacteria bacterium]
MKLISAQIRLFRNILDSTEVDIEDDVTCLVGKNESGKTAFLQALYRLNPALRNVSFSIHEQYPAWLEKRDRRGGIDLEKVCPVRAVFALEEDDRVALEMNLPALILLCPASHDNMVLIDLTTVGLRTCCCATVMSFLQGSVTKPSAGLRSCLNASTKPFQRKSEDPR